MEEHSGDAVRPVLQEEWRRGSNQDKRDQVEAESWSRPGQAVPGSEGYRARGPAGAAASIASGHLDEHGKSRRVESGIWLCYCQGGRLMPIESDRKSTRLNSSYRCISY